MAHEWRCHETKFVTAVPTEFWKTVTIPITLWSNLYGIYSISMTAICNISRKQGVRPQNLNVIQLNISLEFNVIYISFLPYDLIYMKVKPLLILSSLLVITSCTPVMISECGRFYCRSALITPYSAFNEINEHKYCKFRLFSHLFSVLSGPSSSASFIQVRTCKDMPFPPSIK